VVEVGASSLSDDLERKQLLYKRLGVQEYWVVDVAAGQVTALEYPEARAAEFKHPNYQVWESPD